MDKLKLAGLIVIFLIIGLITLSINYKKEDYKIDGDGGTRLQVEKENIGEVCNNGGSIVQYNGYIYYINTMKSLDTGFSNKLCRRKLDEDSKEEILYDAKQYKISDRLIIFNNNIFFNLVGDTYYINLDNPEYHVTYNQGELYYIGNESLIFVYNNNIYKANYYPKTLAIKSIKSIAKGNISYIGEDENDLYFHNNDKSIIKVNKTNQNAYYLEQNTIISNVKKFILSDKYIYLISQYGDNNEIKIIFKDATEVKTIKLENMPNNIYTIKDDLYYKVNNILYKYNPDKDKIAETEIPKSAPNKYELQLNGKNLELYKNDELFITILKGINEKIAGAEIQEVVDNLYIKFYLINEKEETKEMMFWQAKKDGTNLVRLNDTF